MNKQEAIEKIKNLKGLTILDKTINFDDEMISKKDVLNIVKQLDEPVRPPEPKPLEPEKPVVPQFVADWYEENKCYFGWNLYNFCVDFHERKLQEDLREWFADNTNGPIETLVMMHKFGYEVEKEKLYTVEIPNPNGGEYSRVYLGKYSSDKVGLYNWTGFTHIAYANDWKKEEKAQLTEAEIKEDFEWAWEFAEEVE